MARVYREVHQYIGNDGRDTTDIGVGSLTGSAARVVSVIGGVIVALLGLRFLLSLLGANRSNVFADFIYTVSAPFLTPFFGLFNYTPRFGISRFEFETLVAMLAYGIITALIVWALTASRRPYDNTI